MLLCLYCILVTRGRRRRREGDDGGGDGVVGGDRWRQVRVWNDGVRLNLCSQKVRINEYLSGARKDSRVVFQSQRSTPRAPPPRVQAFCNHWPGGGSYAGHVRRYCAVLGSAMLRHTAQHLQCSYMMICCTTLYLCFTISTPL